MVEYILAENNDFLIQEDGSNLILQSSDYTEPYSVKYRLEFSDVLGNGKKVEILKKNYTGSVLPMIGTENPVVVRWSSNDEFYKPIIGSSCTLSLLVTDSVQYDDFYKFDEREYKIVVYSAKSFTDNFVDRVNSDGGIVEKQNCVTKQIHNFPVVNNENVYTYEVFWTGFLVVDRFKEKLQSTPFNLTLNAFDGLGTLDNFDAPLAVNDFYERLNDYRNDDQYALYDYKRIADILANLNLDLDIVFINDTHYRNIYTPVTDPQNVKQWPDIQTIPNYLGQELNGENVFTAKKQLELLLSFYNMRIYQSFGKWYVVEASNIFDQSIKTEIASLNAAGTPPSDIRSLITDKLYSTQNEVLESFRYDKDGVYQATENVSVLKSVNDYLIPIENNLSREFLQPLAESVRDYRSSRDKSFYNNNFGFEYGEYGWTIRNAGTQFQQALISTNGIQKNGSKSIYLNTSVIGTSGTGTLDCFRNTHILDSGGNTALITQGFMDTITAQFSYYIEDTEYNTTSTIVFQIVAETHSTGNDIYYDVDNKTWTSTSSTKTSFDVTSPNNWFTKKVKLPIPSGHGADDVQRTLTIKIFGTETTSTTYVTTYFDTVGFSQTNRIFNGNVSDDVNDEIPNGIKRAAVRTDLTGYTTSKTIESQYFDAFNRIPSQKYWFRSRDKNTITNTKPSLELLPNRINQNIMNDFRDFVTRYYGTLYCLETRPLSMHNKLWFNWIGTLNDLQTCYLDNMIYNVKLNRFEFNAHLPNSDNDITVQNRVLE